MQKQIILIKLESTALKLCIIGQEHIKLPYLQLNKITFPHNRYNYPIDKLTHQFDKLIHHLNT